MAQYRTVYNSGTNIVSVGIAPAGSKEKQPPAPKKIVAGQTVAGGEEIAG